MELWVKLALGTFVLLLVTQSLAGSDRALRARRWAPLIYLPVMLVAALDASGWVTVPAAYLVGWAGAALMCDHLASQVRLDWRNRQRDQPVA